jgi:hypothetical protein
MSLIIQMPLIATVLSLSSFSLLRSLSCCLQSSKPEQLCDSSMRCLPQKWPAQKPQSPTMRCAASRQSLKPQRIFLGAPPRMGSARWIVDSRVMAWAVRGEDGSERCLPAWTRRREVAGRLVRRARRECKVATVVDLGMVMGKAGGLLVLNWVGLGRREEVMCLLSPERFFTKICMVSSGSAEGAREEVEETLEMLLERMMAVEIGLLVVAVM